MHQYSNGFKQDSIPTMPLSTITDRLMPEALVPEDPMAEDPMAEVTVAWMTPSVPEVSKVAIQQLTIELQSERCLNRLERRLSACVSEYLAMVADRDATVGHASVQLAQILADELSLGLTQSCAVVLSSVDIVSDRDESIVCVLEPVFTVCAIASRHAEPALEESCLASTMALMPFVVGQSLSERDLQCWRTQFPTCAWQMHRGQVHVGWLLLGPVPADFQLETLSVLEPFTCLKERLIEQSLDRYFSALYQLEQIQAQAQQRKALAAHNRELQQANHLKSEFLANTSHEIRTPLSSILGFTHLMREQGFNPSSLKHQEYLNIILSSGQHLLALINDILDLSKIEANQLDLHWETVTVKSVCQTAIALVREKANDKGLALTLEIAPQVGTLVADSLRLKQMLFNLLSNALKFTRQGSVGLQVTAADDALRFTVWDTGTGIAEDQQRLLFRPYSQIVNPVARRDEGTGLGLALTQKLAELHGGWVEVSSTIGQGSRFTIVLPPIVTSGEDKRGEDNVVAGVRSTVELGLEAHPVIPKADAVPGKDNSIASARSYTSASTDRASIDSVSRTTRTPSRANHLLLVEDDYYNAKLMLTYLNRLGYEVTWVKDGYEMGQALVRALPALILMDINLPGEDGLALTQQLKLDDRYRSIPIIAQTAMAMSGDRDLCLEAGTVAYISKPIDLKVLAQLIAQYVRGVKD